MHSIEQVLSDYGPALVRIARSYERNPALREDLVQDILLAIHGALPRLKDPSRLRPFLFRIAHNRGVNHIVKWRALPAEDAAELQIPSGEADPEQQLIEDERARRLVEAVRALPLPYRQVATLLLEGLSYAEIAEALGLTLSNVGVRVNRAKAQLKALMHHD